MLLLKNLVRSINIGTVLEDAIIELDIGNIYIRLGRTVMREYIDGCARFPVELPLNYHIIYANATNIGAVRDGQFINNIGYDQYSTNSIRFFQRDAPSGTTPISYIITAVKI